MIEQWTPTIICSGALGLVWFGIRAQKKELKDDIDDVKENYLKKDDHVLLCENSTLKINKHMTKELVGLKDDIFSKLRDLESTIKENSSK